MNEVRNSVCVWVWVWVWVLGVGVGAFQEKQGSLLQLLQNPVFVVLPLYPRLLRMKQP